MEILRRKKSYFGREVFIFVLPIRNKSPFSGKIITSFKIERMTLNLLAIWPKHKKEMQIIYDGRKVQVWEFVSQGLNIGKWSTGKHCDGVVVVKKNVKTIMCQEGGTLLAENSRSTLTWVTGRVVTTHAAGWICAGNTPAIPSEAVLHFVLGSLLTFSRSSLSDGCRSSSCCRCCCSASRARSSSSSLEPLPSLEPVLPSASAPLSAAFFIPFSWRSRCTYHACEGTLCQADVALIQQQPVPHVYVHGGQEHFTFKWRPLAALHGIGDGRAEPIASSQLTLQQRPLFHKLTWCEVRRLQSRGGGRRPQQGVRSRLHLSPQLVGEMQLRVSCPQVLDGGPNLQQTCEHAASAGPSRLVVQYRRQRAMAPDDSHQMRRPQLLNPRWGSEPT